MLCTKGLGFSEGSASKRTKVARLGRRFPEVFERIASMRLTLTSAYLLADVMTDDNALELLDRAHGKSKFEVEKLVATLSPEPDMEEMIRRLPAPAFPGESRLDTGTATATSTPLPIPSRRDTVKPLSQSRTAFKFTGDDELVGMYRKLQDLMRHKYPKGRLEELVKEAFSTLLEKVDPATTEPIARPCSTSARRSQRCEAVDVTQVSSAMPTSASQCARKSSSRTQ
ncbi:MAG: hypothetical protein AAB288_05300, partial [Acidobacteriota bacterium]